MKALLAKLQLRLTLDAGMGEFYVWLVGLPLKIRARELIAMARIGWAVTHGVHVPGLWTAPAPAVMRGEVASAAVEAPCSRGPSKEAAVANFGRSFLTAKPPA